MNNEDLVKVLSNRDGYESLLSQLDLEDDELDVVYCYNAVTLVG